MDNKILLFISLLIFPCPAWADNASSIQRENTRATLVSETSGIVPGKPLNLGILLEAKEGWHTYWENPGEAGLATTLSWTLPDGFAAGAIDWPVPEVITEGPLAVYAYKGTVFLPVTITPPETLDTSKSYPIKVKADWLVCSSNMCVPESAELQLDLPVASTATPSQQAPLFEEHRSQKPVTIEKPVAYISDAGHATIFIPMQSLPVNNIESVTFFARQSSFVKYAAAQKFAIDGDLLHLTIEKSSEDTPEGKLSGILLIDGDGQKKSFDITLETHTPIMLQNGKEEPTWLPFILLSAIMGGLVLNLMPCVLPVLSLKALAIVKKAGHARYHVVRQGMAYTLGILLSFAVIAGILIGLQQSGEAIGWGYQMQSPAFVSFLIYLLFLIGLNLSGVFHLPVLLGSVGSREMADESSLKGSFFTGVLATAVATPCTAPFMASAVGVALTLPPWEAMLVFEALGFGLALPFLLISLFPSCLHFLPKPGSWMNTLKHTLALPMYASVMWLLWVLQLQTGRSGLIVALAGMGVIIFIIRMKPLFKNGHYRLAALILAALTIVFTLPILSGMEVSGAMMPTSQVSSKVATASFSKLKLAELLGAGKPVFIDATAAWCLTCQVNARTSIDTERSMQTFQEHGVTLMIADWTLRNAEITEFLRGFGFNGVPLYVFYPADGKPIVLPQLLTESIVIDAITAPSR